MPDPVWPISLPTPLLSAYAVSDELPLIRTAMENGPDRVTRTSTSFRTDVRFTLVLTRDQFANFRTFFENECNAGANWFDLIIDTSGTLIAHRCRFVASPSYSIDRPFYRANCQIETYDRHIVL